MNANAQPVVNVTGKDLLSVNTGAGAHLEVRAIAKRLLLLMLSAFHHFIITEIIRSPEYQSTA